MMRGKDKRATWYKVIETTIPRLEVDQMSASSLYVPIKERYNVAYTLMDALKSLVITPHRNLHNTYGKSACGYSYYLEVRDVSYLEYRYLCMSISIRHNGVVLKIPPMCWMVIEQEADIKEKVNLMMSKYVNGEFEIGTKWSMGVMPTTYRPKGKKRYNLNEIGKEKL